MTDRAPLLFAIEDADTDAATVVASLIRDLNDQRDWTCGDIEFVDELDETSATRPEDEPIRTLGGVLTLTRPTSDPGNERSQNEDVEFLVDRLCEFSRSGRVLVIEYDGEEIGEIREGRADAAVRVGLLGEWCKPLREP
jgi:hypothetical protein